MERLLNKVLLLRTELYSLATLIDLTQDVLGTDEWQSAKLVVTKVKETAEKIGIRLVELESAITAPSGDKAQGPQDA